MANFNKALLYQKFLNKCDPEIRDALAPAFTEDKFPPRFSEQVRIFILMEVAEIVARLLKEEREKVRRELGVPANPQPSVSDEVMCGVCGAKNAAECGCWGARA